MNNANRTPGDWAIDSDYPFEIVCGDKCIAVVETGDKFSEGDGLLIAAASNLEDFAHEFMRATEPSGYVPKHRVLQLREIAERAIMKSKGLLR